MTTISRNIKCFLFSWRPGVLVVHFYHNGREYGYQPQGFHEFVEVVPSAITELVHWQMQGYGVIRPTIMEKKKSIEEIR